MNEQNPENFDDGLTQVAPKGQFKSGIKEELKDLNKRVIATAEGFNDSNGDFHITDVKENEGK